MATYTSHHIPHLPVDGVVVCRSFLDLGPHIGRSVAWMEGIHVYVLISRLVKPFPCTNKTCKNGGKQVMATDTSSTPPCEWFDGLQILQNLVL